MPPPPPPAPPPPLKAASGNQGKSNFDPPPDRNALLSQIRKGARLKKAETNDRSTPLIEGSKSTSVSTTNKRPGENKSNGPFPVIPPGGLFAQGIPKLRPTVPRAGTQGDSSGPSSMVIQSIKSGHSASFLDHHRVGGQLSRSQPPSPVSKPRSEASTSETASLPSGNPNFPDDINLKGPAPAPPPASQKPSFGNKPTVRRSASQTSLGQRPRLTRPPPNVKPPPPPKSAANGVIAPPPAAPPPPPSKPPNILRRQSFGTGENRPATKLSLPSNNTMPKNVPGPPPPPPPRNNSAPQELNQLATPINQWNKTNIASPRNNSAAPELNQLPTPLNHYNKMNIAPPRNNSAAQELNQLATPINHWNKMNIAPPPPPPNRGRGAPIRPPPPRAPAPPPPPPPQHHAMQAKAALSGGMAAPPPPARVSSMKHPSDFEERFKFHPAQSWPKPEKFPNTHKTYPSKANHSRQKQSTRRMPPPPPPKAGGSSLDTGRGQQPFIHIQLNSNVYT